MTKRFRVQILTREKFENGGKRSLFFSYDHYSQAHICYKKLVDGVDWASTWAISVFDSNSSLPSGHILFTTDTGETDFREEEKGVDNLPTT